MNTIKLILIFIIILKITPLIINAQQLGLNEKPNIIYNMEFKKFGYRLNGVPHSSKTLGKILLDSPATKTLVLKSIKQKKIAFPIFIGSTIPTFIGLKQINNGTTYRDKKLERKGMKLFIAGLALQAITGSIIGKSNRNFKKAIDIFNKGNTAKQLNNTLEKKNDKIDSLNKIINSNFELNNYFINGRKVSHKKVDQILAEQSKQNLFVAQIIEAKKRQKILNYTYLTSGTLSVVIVLLNRNIGSTKLSQASAVSLSFLSASLIAKLFIANQTNKLRYNATRIYNEEPPFQFNRRHKKIIKSQTQLVLGSGDYGYGLLLKF